MADFLAEVAAKNLGTAEVILPRRAALFESVSVASNLQYVTDPEDISTFDEVDLIESLPRTQRRTSESADRSSFTADVIPNPKPLRTPRKFEGGLPSPDISPTPRNVDTEQEPGRLLSRPDPVDTVVSAPARPAKADGPVVPPIHHQTLVSEQSSSRKIKSSEKDKRAEVQTQITARPRVVVSEARAREGVGPRASSNVATKSLDGQTEKAEVPVINVTIGRVEVRALQSQTPARAVQVKSPTLSLDEYLQRRRNGGAQ